MIARLGLHRRKGFDELLLESELDKPHLHLPERIITREMEVAGLGSMMQKSLEKNFLRSSVETDILLCLPVPVVVL